MTIPVQLLCLLSGSASLALSFHAIAITTPRAIVYHQMTGRGGWRFLLGLAEIIVSLALAYLTGWLL